MASGKHYKSIDLFAGIGGIRLGFENAFGKDITTTFVSEWDEYAQKTYAENFSKPEINGDITKINELDIKPFDICLAGFPCQAFSIAGKKQGFNDDYKGTCRGTLFAEVVRICEARKMEDRPKVIFCENVKGLQIHDHGHTLEVILGAFDEIGYNVKYKVLNSKDFGVPQNRERIYIVAFRKDIYSEDFKFPEPTNPDTTIKDILEEKPVSPKYYLSTKYLQCLRDHKARHEAKGHGFGYEIKDPNGYSSAIVCGGMGRERNLIYDDRLTDFTPVTHIKGEINREGVRKMTPREWARLQGFPDSYKLTLADTHLYKQLGNSVTVPVIEAIAREIKRILDRPSGNKGEWSEMYTFLKILNDRRIYGADPDLNKNESIFYDILKIFRKEDEGDLSYYISEDGLYAKIELDCKVVAKIIKERLNTESKYLFSEIKKNKGAFVVPRTEKFMEELHCKKLKAPSNDKTDISVQIHDSKYGSDPILGFSIKSRIGQPSTLFNANKDKTNTLFKLSGDLSEELINKINDRSKDDLITPHLQLITDMGLIAEYVDTISPIFKKNLLYIDSMMPQIVAEMLKLYYFENICLIKDIAATLAKRDPLKFNDKEIYAYKIKNMLVAIALGMVPGTPWKGIEEANGGYIVVKDDGEILCYHLYNRNEFTEYLFNNTKLETPGTTRHLHSFVYKEDNNIFLKLNLQIRFTK